MTQCYVAKRRDVTQCYVEYSKAITWRYVAYREVLLDTKFKKLRAMQVKLNLLISARNLNKIKKYFRVFIRVLGTIDLWKKNEGRKSRETVSLRSSFRVRSIYLKVLQNYFIKSWRILYFIFVSAGVNNPAETDFDDFRRDYLGEYEAICETVLGS
jgi:hypothetical protein